jgi:hypothetical protein
MAVRIQFRRDTPANWTALNPILAQGEIGVELNAPSSSNRFKIGDGILSWNSLTFFTQGIPGPPGTGTDLGYVSATRLLTSSSGADVTLPLVGADAGLMSAADKTKLDGIAAGAQVNVPTDLGYTAASRILTSSTGADVTLPLFSSSDAGFAPQSGGGTANFLRADGTWATPPGTSGATDLGYVAATRLLTSSTGADVTLPLVGAEAGLMAAADKSKLDGIAAGAQVNVPTNISYVAATRIVSSSTGTGFTLPLAGAEAGLMTAADKTKLDGIAPGAQVNAPTDLGYTSATRILTSSTGADVTLPLAGSDPGLMSAADKTKLDGIAAGAQVNVPTDLTYTAATRLLASSTGTDVTLPLVGADAGLMSAADKTKLDGIAAGAQVNVPTDLGYTAGTRLLTSSTGADVTLPLAGADAGLMTAADKTKLDGIAAGAQVNVPTDLGYTAASRILTSSTGADVTLPLFSSADPGLAPASGGGTTNFLRADGTWATPGGGGGGASPLIGWFI